MNIAMDNQWSNENSNFAMDNDYERAFESYISDEEDGMYILKTIILIQKCLKLWVFPVQ